MNRKEVVKKAREVMAHARRVIRKVKAEEGICYFCNNRAEKNRSLCKRHLAEDAHRTAVRKAQRIKDGKCSKCGGTRDLELKMCSKCRKREQVRQGYGKA